MGCIRNNSLYQDPYRSRYLLLKEGRYAKTLAKIQVTAIFLMGDMRRNVDGHQHGGRKPAETSVTEFCYKSVNLSLEELKNVTIILNSNTRTVQIAEFLEIVTFLTNITALSSVM